MSDDQELVKLAEYAKLLRATSAHTAKARGQYFTAAAAEGTVNILLRWVELGYKKVRLNPERLGLSFNTLNVKLNQTLQFIRDNGVDRYPQVVVEAAQRARISRDQRECMFYLTDKGPIVVAENPADALEVVDEDGAIKLREDLTAWLSDPHEEGEKFERECSLAPEDIDWVNNMLEPVSDEYIHVAEATLVKVIKHRASEVD
jgi:hypothetical protein